MPYHPQPANTLNDADTETNSVLILHTMGAFIQQQRDQHFLELCWILVHCTLRHHTFLNSTKNGRAQPMRSGACTVVEQTCEIGDNQSADD